MTVYFIGAYTHDNCNRPFSIKIGYSDFDAEVRKNALQRETGQASILSALASVPGSKELETHLHKRFESLRYHGEWFKYEGNLITLIKQLQKLNTAIEDIGYMGCQIAAGTIKPAKKFSSTLQTINQIRRTTRNDLV